MRSKDATCLPVRLFAIAATLFLITLTAPYASAQQTSATILGQIRDESGAVLPGVSVTATSSALQLQQVVDVTNEQGEFRLTPLPIGSYTLVFALDGFQSVRREDIRLTVGFVARVDEVLKVGALNETVTVSGVSPLVDVTSTSASIN